MEERICIFERRMPPFVTSAGDREPSTSLLSKQRRPMHGKWTLMMMGCSMVLNAVLVLYCANLQFMR